ncbi:MAG: hypothetical protein IJY23_08035 [Clostridia bacterium]|nr:hypothetical protein [Clostridia bacterium]
MKKIIALLLTVAVTLCLLTGCKAKDTGAPPTLEYLYNTSESHQAIGEYIQSAFGAAGITVNLTNQEWGTFLHTRKIGDFTFARNGWLADYSDPISFLDMWTTNSGNNDVQFGKGNHKSVNIYSLDLRDEGYDINVENGTWAETYDALIGIIKSSTDTEQRYRLMHLAEDMLMDTGCITPLYFYTDLYMKDKNLRGFYSSPLGYKFFMHTTYPGKSSISVSLASEPESIDPALSSTVDGATMIAHLSSGLARWSVDADGKLIIVADSAESLSEGVINDDGSVTYTYTLRKGLKWSDGSPVTAGDFEFSWKRAASAELGADYGYMFEVIKGYGEKNSELMVRALDDRTLEVTLSVPVAYWNELLAFPTYCPVKSEAVKNEGWATEAETYIGNGPYVISSWEHNGCITLKKNENYIDRDKVTMPEIKFFLSDDANNMLTNFKNRSWQLIDNLPTNEIDALKRDYPDEFITAGQIGTYYIAWNINRDLLPSSFDKLSANEREIANAEIRRALSLIIDRNYIAEEIGKAGQIPASSFVALGIKNPDGSEFCSTAGNSDSFIGYFDVSREAYKENVYYALDVLMKYYNLKIP